MALPNKKTQRNGKDRIGQGVKPAVWVRVWRAELWKHSSRHSLGFRNQLFKRHFAFGEVP